MNSAAEVRAHYDELLAEHYTWMATGGDYAAGVRESAELLASIGLTGAQGTALDLGCGPGMQAAALLQRGFARVVAVDTCEPLIAELRAQNADAWRAGTLQSVLGDLLNASLFGGLGPFAAILCLGDTLSHLPDLAAVDRLLDTARALLNPQGRLLLRFRDLSGELTGTDRFIPVRSDADKIMTCFLESTADASHLRVTDLIYLRQKTGNWDLRKSSYQKLRLSGAAIAERLGRRGFELELNRTERGLVTLLAQVP